MISTGGVELWRFGREIMSTENHAIRAKYIETLHAGEGAIPPERPKKEHVAFEMNQIRPEALFRDNWAGGSTFTRHRDRGRTPRTGVRAATWRSTTTGRMTWGPAISDRSKHRVFDSIDSRRLTK